MSKKMVLVPQDALEKLLNYVYSDEAENFFGGEKDKNHIWHPIKKLAIAVGWKADIKKTEERSSSRTIK